MSERGGGEGGGSSGLIRLVMDWQIVTHVSAQREKMDVMPVHLLKSLRINQCGYVSHKREILLVSLNDI